MLERNRFVLARRPPARGYDILDADTGEVVGTADEQGGGFAARARRALGGPPLPGRVEVREKPDDSLVFVLRGRGGLFRPRVEVVDAQDELVGSVRGLRPAPGRRFRIHNRGDRPIAGVSGNPSRDGYRLITPHGLVEIAHVSNPLDPGSQVAGPVTRVLDIAPELNEQPLVKMVVLAAALVIDMIGKEPSPT